MRDDSYLDRYQEELDYFRADLPIRTGEKIEHRCRTLSLLLTAAFRRGELTDLAQLRRVHTPPPSVMLPASKMGKRLAATRACRACVARCSAMLEVKMAMITDSVTSHGSKWP